MPRTQFVVPQFLDVEPKIIGPVTLRQFLIVLGIGLIEFALYSFFLNIVVQVVIGIPVAAIGGIFAFGKINGQPFHYVALNMVQTLGKPGMRVWDKTLTDQDLRFFMKKPDVPPPPEMKRKAPLQASRLSELSLVVNTGGVYTGEE